MINADLMLGIIDRLSLVVMCFGWYIRSVLPPSLSSCADR